jgi:hypothetical protein
MATMKQLPQKENTYLEIHEEQVYQAPAVIYEGVISTRAGSPLSNPLGVDDINPDDLFD